MDARMPGARAGQAAEADTGGGDSTAQAEPPQRQQQQLSSSPPVTTTTTTTTIVAPKVVEYTSRLCLGYRERFMDPCVVGVRQVGGREVTVRLGQRPTLPGKAAVAAGNDEHEVAQATGCTVWDGALALGQYLTSLSPSALHHSSSSGGGGGGGSRAGADNHEERPNCLELGSGTGALGLTVGASGIVRSVVLTDMAAVLPLTRENMRGNRAVLADGGVLCGVAPLLWSTDSVRARQSSVAGTVSRFSTAVRSLLAGLKRSCLACCFAGGGEGTAGQLGGWPPL
jgi:hypothetical protein